jgi:hypothetical protein
MRTMLLQPGKSFFKKNLCPFNPLGVGLGLEGNFKAQHIQCVAAHGLLLKSPLLETLYNGVNLFKCGTSSLFFLFKLCFQ